MLELTLPQAWTKVAGEGEEPEDKSVPVMQRPKLERDKY